MRDLLAVANLVAEVEVTEKGMGVEAKCWK